MSVIRRQQEHSLQDAKKTQILTENKTFTFHSFTHKYLPAFKLKVIKSTHRTQSFSAQTFPMSKHCY